MVAVVVVAVVARNCCGCRVADTVMFDVVCVAQSWVWGGYCACVCVQDSTIEAYDFVQLINGSVLMWL